MADPLKNPDNNNMNEQSGEMPVGEILRRTREHYELSLDQVEYNLHIRAEQLHAVEINDQEILPARVYVIGFVRSYSEYLGLDGDKMVDLYKRQIGAAKIDPELHYPVIAEENQAPPWWILIICIIGAVVLAMIFLGDKTDDRELVENIPPVPQEIQEAQIETAQAIDEMTNPPPIEEEVIAPQEDTKTGIILNIRENSWVEIRDQSEKALISQVLKAGDQYYVPDRPDLTISVGNAGGVDMVVDGVKLRKLGKTGEVLRKLSLDAAYLKTNFASKNQEP